MKHVSCYAQVFLRQTKSKVADPSGSGYSDLEEWVLDTEGVNLAEVSLIIAQVL